MVITFGSGCTIDVCEPLAKHVSIIRGNERSIYAVRYENWPCFARFVEELVTSIRSVALESIL